jgi:hypothetical protein
MIRPLDAGVRTEEEMRDMLPRLSDLAAPLEAMVAGFPDGFDVNVGNLPYCVAPSLAHVIHHDGSPTATIAVDRDDSLSEPWDKYAVKARDKVKIDACKECVFDDRCSGVYETYVRFHGTSELAPIPRTRLPVIDPKQRLFTLHAAPWLDELRAMGAEVHVDSHAQRILARFASVQLGLERPGGGAASTDAFSMFIASADVLDDEAMALVREVFRRLVDASGAKIVHDVGDDAAFHGPMRAMAPVDHRIGRCLARLRSSGPYPELTWRSARVGEGGRAAEVELRHEGGVGVTLAFAVHGEGVRGGYKLDRKVDSPLPGLVAGVRAAMSALRGD